MCRRGGSPTTSLPALTGWHNSDADVSNKHRERDGKLAVNLLDTGSGSGGEPASCYQKVAGLIARVCMPKFPWAATTISVSVYV